MRSKKEAKRILKAFGRAEGKARIEYIDSFLPEKTSYIGSINYKHMLRRAAIVVVLMVMIMALAASAYAAVLHYLNYKRAELSDHDQYSSLEENAHPDGTYDAITFYEPTYIPDGYTLESEDYVEEIQYKHLIYVAKNGKSLSIIEFPEGVKFQVDNETSTRSTEVIDDTEVVIYSFEGETMGILQFDKTVIVIDGSLGLDEIKKIILGLKP